MQATTPKTIIITGASDGIGKEAARQLKADGHNVVIVGRTASKVQKVAKELDAPFHIADFSDLSDVRRLANELRAYPKIDVLANNAGAIMNTRSQTMDGFERTFQVNVLAQFLLTNSLLDKLCQSNATVIQTSSLAAKLFGRKLNLDDLQNQKDYTSLKSYGESKLCNILFTEELHRRNFSKGLCAVAFEPGISRTNFAAEGPRFFKFMYHTPLKYLFTISQKRSAKRLVRLAEGTPQQDFVCGKTYSYKKPFKDKFNDDGTVARLLWEMCYDMTKQYLTTEQQQY